jgi:Flp pilus assembly protein TadD
LAPAEQATIEARSARFEVALGETGWAEVVALAPQIVQLDQTRERPWVCWGYALRELQRVEEAQQTLLAGARLITEPSVLVPYNLACYACLLGDWAEARQLLASVVARDPHWAEEARQDPDLAALFAEGGVD